MQYDAVENCPLLWAHNSNSESKQHPSRLRALRSQCPGTPAYVVDMDLGHSRSGLQKVAASAQNPVLLCWFQMGIAKLFLQKNFNGACFCCLIAVQRVSHAQGVFSFVAVLLSITRLPGHCSPPISAPSAEPCLSLPWRQACCQAVPAPHHSPATVGTAACQISVEQLSLVLGASVQAPDNSPRLQLELPPPRSPARPHCHRHGLALPPRRPHGVQHL